MDNEAHVSQERILTPEEEQRVISFFEILIEIDRRIKKKKLKSNNNNQEIVDED